MAAAVGNADLQAIQPSSAQARVERYCNKDLIAIDPASGVPLWLQLRNRLVFLIVSGAYPAGAQLPTVRELSGSLSLNYNTITKVYRDLEKDGYVITQRGRGTFVAEVNTQDAQVAEGVAAAELLVDTFLEQCKELGLSEADAASLVAQRAGGIFV